MIERIVHIRRWEILFLFCFDTNDLERVQSALIWADAPDSIIHHVSGNVSAGYLNEGFTYSNPALRRTVFAVGMASSGPQVLDSIVHEIIHIVQHIGIEDGMDPYGEEVAYLGGNISREISDIVCQISCPHCQNPQM